MQIKIVGWESGFAKVKANRLFRAELGDTIALAKNRVDRILENEEIIIFMQSTSESIVFCEKLKALGLKVRLIPDSEI